MSSSSLPLLQLLDLGPEALDLFPELLLAVVLLALQLGDLPFLRLDLVL